MTLGLRQGVPKVAEPASFDGGLLMPVFLTPKLPAFLTLDSSPAPSLQLQNPSKMAGSYLIRCRERMDSLDAPHIRRNDVGEQGAMR